MPPEKIRRYSNLLIRVGLALVFLANSYTAFFSPDDFTKFISESFLSGLLPVSVELFIKFIGLSDGLVALLLLLGKGQKYLASYASLWILGVMAVVGLKDPSDLLEHFGFLALSLYLIINN